MNHTPAPGSLNHLHGQHASITHQLSQAEPGSPLYQALAHQLAGTSDQVHLVKTAIQDYEQRGTRGLF